jgi:mannosyltransferase
MEIPVYALDPANEPASGERRERNDRLIRGPRDWPEWAAVAVVAAAVAIRLYHLGKPSLEIDEATSYRIATMPWDALWRFLPTRETNRGLYYLFLRPWVAVFGYSEAALRMPSVLASSVTVALVYAAGKRLFGKNAGVLAALLFALSPVSIMWARDTTAYAFEMMFVTAGLLFLLRALERPTAGNLAGWVLSLLLAVFAHAIAITAVAAQVLPLAVLDRRQVPWRRLLTATAILLGLMVPVMGWMMYTNIGHDLVAWIKQLSWLGLGQALYGLVNGLTESESSGQMTAAAYAVGLMLGFVATVRAWDRSRAEAMPFLLAASGVVLPLAQLVAVSFIKPTLYFRFLIFCVPSLCLFVAGGLAATRMRSIATFAFGALAIACSWHTWFMLERDPRPDFRQVASYILSRAQPGDALAVRYWQNLQEMDYYFRRLGMPTGLIEDVFPDWGSDLFIDGKYPMDLEAQEFMARHLLAQIDSTAARGKRLWLVVGNEWMGLSFERVTSLRVLAGRVYADYGSVDRELVDGFMVILCSDPRKPIGSTR